MPRQPRTSIDMAILKRQLTLRDDTILEQGTEIMGRQREIEALRLSLLQRKEGNNDGPSAPL